MRYILPLLGAAVAAFIAGVVKPISESTSNGTKRLMRWIGQHWKTAAAATVILGVGVALGFAVGRDGRAPARLLESPRVTCPPVVGSHGPRLTVGLSVSSGSPGTEIVVTGTGFVAGEVVNLALLRVVGSRTEIVTAKAVNAYIAGRLDPQTFEVPETAVYGEHYLVSAEDSKSLCSVTAQFTVT